MATHRRIDIICAAVLLFTLGLTVLFLNGTALGLVSAASGDSASDLFTANDLNADWDVSSATKIVLSDQGSTISGNGAYVYNGDVYIAYAGRYVLTGALTDGAVIVDGEKSDKIWISLDGVSIHCEDDAAIRIEQAGKVFLTLADGTSNTVSSGSAYRSEAADSGVDGAIYSRDDLTINGSGALTVDTGYCHGIVCNDDLVLTGGDITITAVQDGIHANDSVRIRSASLSISAGDDGITVSNDDETAFLYVESGRITIPACYEGLEAIDITIAGGVIDIMSTDDGINANGDGSSSVIRITGGEITITNPDGRDADGLDSNGSIYIEGGKTLISVSDSSCALDYGSENGGECLISGGTIAACGGSMMAEGFDSASPQGFLMYSTNAAAGAEVSLEDSSGKTLFSESIPCGFSSVVLSTPELSVGDACTLVIDGVREQITIDNSSASGFSPAGMFRNGMRGGPDSPPQQDQGPSGDMEPPARPDMPDGEDWTDRQMSQEGGGRPFMPDAGERQEDGMRFPQQNREQMERETSSSSSSLSAETWILLGVSALTLLAGLLIASRSKHFF